MRALKDIVFYFANPQQDEEGNPIMDALPEHHVFTLEEIRNNVSFTLSTGETMFTEMPNPDDIYTLRLVNGFYFGEGRRGSLLAIQYRYHAPEVFGVVDEWSGKIRYRSNNSQHLQVIESKWGVDHWIEGLTYQQIIQHKNYTGKPYIGYENDYVEVEMLKKGSGGGAWIEYDEKEVKLNEEIHIRTEYYTLCEDDTVTFEWVGATDAYEIIYESLNESIIKFTKSGKHVATIEFRDACGIRMQRSVTLHVDEEEYVPPEPDPCELELIPTSSNLKVGERAVFTAMHPYSETGTWTYDERLIIIQENDKVLEIETAVTGEFDIEYQVKHCIGRARIYVTKDNTPPGDGENPPVDEEDPIEWEDPVEPPPPPFQNRPPDSEGSTDLVIELEDASVPVEPLYKYPNIMKRNARYRGHRESEKFLNDHQEQIYDIRKIHQDISHIKKLKDITIESWFHNEESTSISTILEGREKISNSKNDSFHVANVDTVRAFNNDMIQLSGNQFEERIVGVNRIKQRMQEMNERIAEAERRYKQYENAYK